MVFTGCNKKNKDKEPEQQQEAPKDFAGLTFADLTVTYDGQPHKIEVSGLPEGATVSYGETGNEFTLPGEYPITATVSGAGYNNTTLTATLTIQKATFTGVSLPLTQVVHDGEKHTIQVAGELPQGATFTYDDGFDGATELGVHQIKGTLSATGYNDLQLSSYLTIFNGDAAEARTIADFNSLESNSELAEKFDLKFYKNNTDGWVTPQAAALNLTQDPYLGQDNSKFMTMAISHQGSAFRASTKDMEKDLKKYTGFSFDSFMLDWTEGGTNELEFQLYFKDIPLPAQYQSMKDAWATYRLAIDAPRNWVHWEVPFDDPNVSLMNGAVTLNDLASIGYTMKDLSLYIDSVAIIVKPNYVSGKSCYTFVDNVKLLTGQVANSKTQNPFGGKYSAITNTGAEDQMVSIVVDSAFENAVFSVDGALNVPLAIEKTANSATFKDTLAGDHGAQLTVEAEILNGGLKVTGISGAQVANFGYLENLFVQRVANLNYDFQDMSGSFADSTWKQEKYTTSWVDAGTQTYLKTQDQNKYISTVAGAGMTMRFTKSLVKQEIGFANTLSFDIGNDYNAEAKDVRIKIKLIRADMSEFYIVGGDGDDWGTVPASTPRWTHQVFNSFDECIVRGIVLTYKDTKSSGQDYVYLDNIKLGYEKEPERSLPDGSYYLWNSATDCYTMTVASSGTTATLAKVGGDSYPFSVAKEGNNITLDCLQQGALTIKGVLKDDGILKIKEVTGAAASTFRDSLLFKRFKNCAEINLDFEDGTAGSAYTNASWAQQYYDNGWKSTSGKMNCREKGGTKVVNMGADSYARKFIYTPALPIGPVNHLDIDFGNYFNESAGAIKYKISIIDNAGNATRYIAGDANNFATIAYESVSALKTLHFDFDLAVGAKLQITTQRSGSTDTWLYMDNIHLTYQAPNA